MHVQTHILSGWCVANVLPLGKRERLLCMVAAAVPDLDGLAIIAGQEAYWTFHHLVGHNLLFAVLGSILLSVFSSRRLVGFIAYLALFHLHFVMDLYGSGPLWTIPYDWPMGSTRWMTAGAWEFDSWQNRTAAGVLLLWTLILIRTTRRTPLEVLMPVLDQRIVKVFARV